MSVETSILCLLFFLVAFFYSSAGFGGGSSYLAILAMTTIDYQNLRAISLMCNIIVVSGSCYLFIKHNHLEFKRVIWIVIFSVPFAFLGGRYLLEEKVFFIALAIVLLISGSLMLIDFGNKKTMALPKGFNIITGSGIGLLSGLVGIGGGIFLSPVLHLTKWANVKSIAATTAFFILLNSIAGIIGQISKNGLPSNFNLLLPLAISVIIGGQIGVRLTIFKLSAQMIKRITAILVLFVTSRLLLKYLI